VGFERNFLQENQKPPKKQGPWHGNTAADFFLQPKVGGVGTFDVPTAFEELNAQEAHSLWRLFVLKP